MEEACCQAVKLGLKEIAITDHMDIDLPENLEAYQIEDLNLYMEELVLVKDQFQDCLNVKAGIELGLQDWTLEKSVAIANDYPFDFVIASIHMVNGEDPYNRIYFNSRDKLKSYTDYYATILDVLKDYDDFNVLGHLDYLRRYSPYEYVSTDYKIGEEMLLIAESLHNKSKPIIKKVKIISIDNSLLKVTDDAKEIMFYDSIVSHLCPINFTYILCKSEEDYKQYKKNCQEIR